MADLRSAADLGPPAVRCRIFGDPALSSRPDPGSELPCGGSYSAGVDTLGFESLILYVSDLEESRAFYAGGLGLPVVFEDDVIVVVGGPAGRVVLHRNDRGHDERGTFPAGNGVGGWPCGSPSRIPTSASGRRRRPGSRFSGRRRTRRGGASSCSPIPTAARSSSPG